MVSRVSGYKVNIKDSNFCIIWSLFFIIGVR